MTTREMEVQYSNLRQLWENGRMATQQFQESVSQLRMQESDGTWLQINPNDGQWLMWNGNSWVIVPQPIPKQMTASFSEVSSLQPLPFKLLFRQIMKVTLKNFIRRIPFTILISAISAVVLAFLNFYIIAFKRDGYTKLEPSDAALGLGMNPLIGSIYGGIVISTLFTILFIFLKNARQKGAGKAFGELLDIPSLISRYFHEAGPVAMASLVSGAGMALLIGCLLNRFASLAIALGVGGLIMSSARSGMSTLVSSAWEATYGTVKVQQKKEFPIEAGYVVMIGSSIGFILRAYFSTPIAFITGLVLLGVALSLVKGGFRATATLLLMAFGIPFLLDLLAQVGMVFGHDGGAYEHVAQGKPMSTYWKSEGCQKIMKLSATHGAATGIGTGILTTFWHSLFDTLKSGPGSMPGGKETVDRTMIAQMLKGSQDSSLYSGGFGGTPGITMAGTSVGAPDISSIYETVMGKGTPEQIERWKRIFQQRADLLKQAEAGGEVTPSGEEAQTTEGEVPTSETAETAEGTEPTTETKPEETAPQKAGKSPAEEKAEIEEIAKETGVSLPEETGKKEEEYKEEPTPTSEEAKPEETKSEETPKEQEQKPKEKVIVGTGDVTIKTVDGKLKGSVVIHRDEEGDETSVSYREGGVIGAEHKADKSSDDSFREGKISKDGDKVKADATWQDEEGDKTTARVSKDGVEVEVKAKDATAKEKGSDDRLRDLKVRAGGGEDPSVSARVAVKDHGPIQEVSAGKGKEGIYGDMVMKTGKGSTVQVGVDENQKPIVTFRPHPGSTVEEVRVVGETPGVKLQRNVDVKIPGLNIERKISYKADLGEHSQTATIVDQQSGKGFSVTHGEDGKTHVAPVLKTKNFEAGPLKNVLPNITGPQYDGIDDVTSRGIEQSKPEGIGVKYTTDIRNIDPTRLFKRLFGRRRR